MQNPNSRILIVAPTRELAVQITEEFKAFTYKIPMFAGLCIGGASINQQIRHLQKSPQFVIGTPGRLKDLQKRKTLAFSQFSTIVLDEVDRMLDMGFIHDMRHIISQLPDQRHSVFFSATLPQKVQTLMQEFLQNPVTIQINSTPTAHNVDQDIVKIKGESKIEVLHELLIQKEFQKVLVFGRTKRGVEKLTKELHIRGFRTAAIHGNKSQGQRQRALKQFQNNDIQILLATDVASRGLDIHNITHVINYDLPETQDDYTHRIGRTGRANNKGVALTFVE